LAEEYMASVDQIFVILADWKSDSCRFVNPSLLGNWFHVSHCSIFWQHESVILLGLWDPRIKAILLSLNYYSVFWRL